MAPFCKNQLHTTGHARECHHLKGKKKKKKREREKEKVVSLSTFHGKLYVTQTGVKLFLTFIGCFDFGHGVVAKDIVFDVTSHYFGRGCC
jgi:hypothetical protein